MKLNWDALDKIKSLDCDYAQQFEGVLNEYTQKEIEPYNNSIILSDDIPDEWGLSTSMLFQSWRDNPSHAPSLLDLLAGVIDYFNLEQNNPFVSVAMVCCLLGEIENKNAYHNNAHFREVVCMTMKLFTMHNALNKNPSMELSHDDILLLFSAAAIHDFAHDGQNNIVDGVHVTSRLENRAFNKAKPFLDAIGVDDDNAEKIKQIILSTDVTRGDKGRSPAGYVRDIFLAQNHDNVSIVNAPDDYDMILKSPKLTLMCVLLCEADIGASSGLDYEFSKEMTKLVAQESSVLKPTAKTLHGFMEVICHGGFLSRAAQVTLGQNFQGILLQAEQDKDGNVLYA